MTLEDVLEELDGGGEAQLLEPRTDFDSCIAGLGVRFHDGPLAVYDVDLVLRHFMDRGLSEEEAQEYFDVNVAGSWVGNGTPMFVRFIDG